MMMFLKVRDLVQGHPVAALIELIAPVTSCVFAYRTQLLQPLKAF
jgi:hypothetical protein